MLLLTQRLKFLKFASVSFRQICGIFDLWLNSSVWLGKKCDFRASASTLLARGYARCNGSSMKSAPTGCPWPAAICVQPGRPTNTADVARPPDVLEGVAEVIVIKSQMRGSS